MTPKPHQSRTVDSLFSLFHEGVRRVAVTVPTGGGKTFCDALAIRRARELEWSAVVYTNRKMLTEQLSRDLQGFGIAHGVRADGYPDERDLPVQIASIQTEGARTLKTREWTIHGDGRECLVIVDEAHVNTGNTCRELLGQHAARGHWISGWTATPLGLEDVYDRLLIGATVRELMGKDCGMLVPAHHYAGAEIDTRVFQTELDAGEDVSEAKMRKAIHLPTLFGNVFHTYQQKNPYRLPAILFASGVPESLWFAQEFTRQGVPAAHIDGENVWIAGERLDSDRDSRAEVAEASRTGKVQVVCNRFVLREGINMPWLEVGILATAFGSVQTYLQSVGRLLRSSEGKDRAVILDHGGNYYRHGSANWDRAWELGDTAAVHGAMHAEACREGRQREPFACRNCGKVIQARKCSECGEENEPRLRTRPVIQSDGSLVEVRGPVFRPRETKVYPDTAKHWTAIYFRGKKAAMTFRQAYGLFFHTHHYWPPKDILLMPKEPRDWHRAIGDVPQGELTQPYEKKGKM